VTASFGYLMARYAANAPSKRELPAPACVCALFVAGALTKYGHPELAIGATIFLSVLHLAAQFVKRGTSFVQDSPYPTQ
jgi:hypothetical protein